MSFAVCLIVEKFCAVLLMAWFWTWVLIMYSWRQYLLRGVDGPWSVNFDWLVCRPKPQLSLGDADQLLGLVWGNGRGNGRSQGYLLWFFGILSGAIRKRFLKVPRKSLILLVKISPPYQESRVETRKWNQARIDKSDQDRQPINQSTVVTHSKDKGTLSPVIHWLIDWLISCPFCQFAHMLSVSRNVNCAKNNRFREAQNSRLHGVQNWREINSERHAKDNKHAIISNWLIHWLGVGREVS